MTFWEYLVEGLPSYPSYYQGNIGIVKQASPQNMLAMHLNQRGMEGWELVQFASTAGGVTACNIYEPGIIFVFKKPKSLNVS
jgi:hypothetical protein